MMKIYPCARYHKHLSEIHAEQKAVAPSEILLERDSSFCAFACGQAPTAVEVPDGDAQFWSCPCAIARAMRDAKTQEHVLHSTANSHPAHVVRVRALLELADLAWPSTASRQV